MLYIKSLFLKPLVDDIINVHNKRIQDNSILKLLLIEKTKTKSALDNLLNAIENGLISKSTKERLEELEAKLSNLEGNIAYEETKVKMQLTHNEVLQYFKKAIKHDPSTMIRMLINKVILYDDKVEIYYKYTNNLKPDDNNRQAFSFYKGYCDIEIPNRNLSAGYLIHSAIIELFI